MFAFVDLAPDVVADALRDLFARRTEYLVAPSCGVGGQQGSDHNGRGIDGLLHGLSPGWIRPKRTGAEPFQGTHPLPTNLPCIEVRGGLCSGSPTHLAGGFGGEKSQGWSGRLRFRGGTAHVRVPARL